MNQQEDLLVLVERVSTAPLLFFNLKKSMSNLRQLLDQVRESRVVPSVDFFTEDICEFILNHGTLLDELLFAESIDRALYIDLSPQQQLTEQTVVDAIIEKYHYPRDMFESVKIQDFEIVLICKPTTIQVFEIVKPLMICCDTIPYRVIHRVVK